MNPTSPQPPAPLLRLTGIHKRFPGVHVLKGINFEVLPGEVHALVGENGAGKSTLMHILAGVHQPDEGQIEFGGQVVRFSSEQHSQALGIGIVFQERSLFSTLTIAENVFAGRQPASAWGHINGTLLDRETRRLLDQVGLDFPPRTILSDLSPAQQQMVEIAKALSLEARLIIFDEPTAALTDTETQALYKVIAGLKARGVSVIYISHRLEEIFHIADRVSVLKDGEWQGTLPVATTSPTELIRKMVGRELLFEPRPAATPGAVVLEVKSLEDAMEPLLLRDINFHACAGEILAFAGLAGAGRTEMALSIFGARPWGSGALFINGKPVSIHSPADAIAAGIGYLSEDRKDAGVFLDMSISQNVVAASLQKFGRWQFSDVDAQSVADDFRQKLNIACRDVRQTAQSLSGGNQQKVILARWLLVNPLVLIVDEPTRGIDVGAKAEVHRLLHELALKGTAVIVISSDLPEVLAVADRILVMRQGSIAGELSRGTATEESIMRLAAMKQTQSLYG